VVGGNLGNEVQGGKRLGRIQKLRSAVWQVLNKRAFEKDEHEKRQTQSMDRRCRPQQDKKKDSG